MRCRNVPYAFRSSARVAGRGLRLMWVAELRGKAAQQRRQLRGLLLSLSTDQAAGTVDVNRVPPARQIRCSGLIANTIRRPGGSIPESASSMSRAWTRMSCDETGILHCPPAPPRPRPPHAQQRHLDRLVGVQQQRWRRRQREPAPPHCAPSRGHYAPARERERPRLPRPRASAISPLALPPASATSVAGRNRHGANLRRCATIGGRRPPQSSSR